MTLTKGQVGRLGEEYAAARLQQMGYRVVTRNLHSRYGEIDLIVQNGVYLAFVEVKTRAQNSWAAPQAAVTVQKQRKIIATAQWYLQQHPCDLQPRFDVCAVTIAADTGSFSVVNFAHFPGAFFAQGQY